jgi:hypothetical protein
MNGRVYDPTIGRFLSADPIIQTIALSQAINPFSYVMNMPLTLIDPSGLSWLSKLFSGIGSFLKKYGSTIISIVFTCIGFPYIGAFLGSLFSAAVNGGNIGGFLTGLAIGMVAGAIAGPIGGKLAGLVSKGATEFASKVIAGAITGGLAGGISSVAMGGSFGSGFLGGAIVGGLTAGLDAKYGKEARKPSNGPDSESTNNDDKESANKGAPARFEVVSAESKGDYEQYKYQLTDADGNALTGPGYKAAEFISPSNTTVNANGEYVTLNHGVFTDNVGWQSGIVPITANIVTTQWFSVMYQGRCYSISTVFQHINLAVGGTPANTVTVIHP